MMLPVIAVEEHEVGTHQVLVCAPHGWSEQDLAHIPAPTFLLLSRCIVG